MSRSALAGIVGLLAIAGLSSTPADARGGGGCLCGGPRAHHAPAENAHTRVSPIPNRFVHPRWSYAAAYYNPPRDDGYTLMAGAPSHRVWRRFRRW